MGWGGLGQVNEIGWVGWRAVLCGVVWLGVILFGAVRCGAVLLPCFDSAMVRRCGSVVVGLRGEVAPR